MDSGNVDEGLKRLGIDAPGLRAVPIDGAPDVVWAFDVEPPLWFDVWRTLRSDVSELGHWPVATTTHGMPLESVGGMEIQGPDGLDVTPSAIIDRVPGVDIDRLLAVERERMREDWIPDEAELEMIVAEAALEGVDLARLRRELGESPDELDVERWLLDIEVARGDKPNAYHHDKYLEWWVPDDVVMLLVPTVVPWEVGAYVGGFGWGYPHTDLRTALLRRWHERHSAELAANWGTILQFVVPRPPATIDEAWTVAHEVNLTWPDTAGGANGIATRWHAHDLVGRSEWFLHSRP